MNKLQKIYRELRKRHGHPKDQWLHWCKRPKSKADKERVIMGAILTQQTNWNNVCQALDNLNKAGIKTLKDIAALEKEKRKVANLIKPSGFYKTKTKYLFNLVDFLVANYEDFEKIDKSNLLPLREKLIKVKGVGKETADAILLYAFEQPVFVIDQYTRRFAKRKKITNKFSYEHLQTLFQTKVKKDYRLYQDYHALIVIAEQHYAKSQLYN